MTSILAGGAAVLLLLAYRFLRRRPADVAARNILRHGRIVFSPTHEYREVSLADFPHLDGGFYERGRAALEGEGFTWLAEIQDVTLEAPSSVLMPVAARILLGDGGTVTAALYHARLKPGVQTSGPSEFRVVDLLTRLDDGHFVMTSTSSAAALLDTPPEVHIEFVDALMSPPTTLVRHRERVEAHLAERPGVGPRAGRTLDDVIEDQHALNEVKARFRAAKEGMYSTEEMERLAPKGAEPLGRDVADRMREMDARRGGR